MERRRILPIRRYNDYFYLTLSLMPWVKEVYLVAEPNPCDECRAASQVYGRAQVPQMPVRGCSKSEACGCWLAVVTPSEPRRSTDPGRSARAA
jgi:hypothetical protein